MKAIDYEKILRAKINEHIEQGYKIILKKVYNPAKSIFVSDRNQASFARVTFCNACENCEAYKRGQCAEADNLLLHKHCPHSKVYKLEGPTRRSKFYSDFVVTCEKTLDITDRIVQRLSGLTSSITVGGDYVYINLPHLDNYVNPIAEEIGFDRGFIPLENFTDELIIKLLNYHPLAVFGGEIPSYQRDAVPKFIINLRENFKEIYNRIIKDTDYEKGILNYDYRNRKAILQTLKPGKVKYGNYIWEWDGTVLKACEEMPFMEFDEVKPKKDIAVIIVDNNTVDEEKTKFKN